MGAWARTVDGIKREVMQGERHSTSTSRITSMMLGHKAFLTLASMRFHVPLTYGCGGCGSAGEGDEEGQGRGGERGRPTGAMTWPGGRKAAPPGPWK